MTSSPGVDLDDFRATTTRDPCVYVCLCQMLHASLKLLAIRRSSTTASPRSSASRPAIRRPTSTSVGRAAGVSRPVTATTATRSSRFHTEPCYVSAQSVRAATTVSSSVWPRTASATRPLPRPPCKSTPRDLVRLSVCHVVHVREKNIPLVIKIRYVTRS